MAEKIEILVSRLAEYLRTREQQLRCFHDCKSQVEGWFKGELLYFLDRERREGRLHDFKREKSVGVGKTRIDVVLNFNNNMPVQWVELKHLIEAYFAPSQYFTLSEKRTDSFAYCVKGLQKISKADDKFMLVLFTPNPSSKRWNNCVKEFNKKFSKNLRCSLKSLTKPEEYPDYFFLGLLHVCSKKV